jgi:hypothetical protein
LPTLIGHDYASINCDQLPGDAFGVLLDGQLGEDLFECRKRHQIAQLLDGIIGNHATLMQDHHMRTDPLDGFELVRAEQDHFSARGEFSYEVAEDQGRIDVQTGERLVE